LIRKNNEEKNEKTFDRQILIQRTNVYTYIYIYIYIYSLKTVRSSSICLL